MEIATSAIERADARTKLTMKTADLKIIPGPWRVSEEKHDDGSLIIRGSGCGDVPENLVVALVAGGGPEEYEHGTAKLIAATPDLLAALEKCFWHFGREIERMSLIESAASGTQAMSREVARLLDSVRPLKS